jgi:hypothetical protein
MPEVPAFCDSCGAIFRSGMVFENSQNVTFHGVQAGPCPRCGGMGHVPDGVFNFIGETIEVLGAPGRTRAELQQFARILRQAEEQQVAPAELAATLQKELPAFAPIAAILPTNRAELYEFIKILISIIALIFAVSKGDDLVKVEFNQVINNLIREEQVQKSRPEPGPRTAAPVKRNKVARNSPCPCGSGKKYKNCHGQ